MHRIVPGTLRWVACTCLVWAGTVWGAMEDNTNLFGSDYRSFEATSAQQCESACGAEAQCKAWTWVRPTSPATPAAGGGRLERHAIATKGVCWLKNAVPVKSANACCVSGVRAQVAGIYRGPPPPATSPATPPTATLQGGALMRGGPGPSAAPARPATVGILQMPPTVRIESNASRLSRQKVAEEFRRDNALAESAYRAALTEQVAENLVQQGVLKPEIYSINGLTPARVELKPGVQFTIKGRGLGKTGEIRLSGNFRNPVPVMVVDWRPSVIIARIAENISGEYDQQNVRLEVLPLGGTEAVSASDLRFKAAREFMLLKNLPRRYVTLTGWPAVYTTDGDRSGHKTEQGFEKSVKRQTAIVTRANSGVGSAPWFPGGTDIYRLPLRPGFEIEWIDFDHGLTRTNPDECTGKRGGEYFQGRYWATISGPDSVSVEWGVWRCHSSGKWAGVGMIPATDANESAYALDITLWGPRGADPFSR